MHGHASNYVLRPDMRWTLRLPAVLGVGKGAAVVANRDLDDAIVVMPPRAVASLFSTQTSGRLTRKGHAAVPQSIPNYELGASVPSPNGT